MPDRILLELIGDQVKGYVFDTGGERLRDTFELHLPTAAPYQSHSPFEVVLSLPLDRVDLRELELPFSDHARIKAVLPFELEGKIISPADTLVMDAAVITEAPPGGKARVLAAYASLNETRALLEKLSALGLEPRVVTSTALSSLIRRLREGEQLADAIAYTMDEDPAERPIKDEALRPAINLRTGPLAYTRDIERTHRSLIYIGALLLLLAALVATDVMARATALDKEAAALEKATALIYAEMFPEDKSFTQQGLTLKAKAKLNQVRQRHDQLRGIEPLDFMQGLQGALPAGVVVTEVSLDREGAVALKGDAPSLMDVEALSNGLKAFLSQVSITQTGKGVKGMTDFEIKAIDRSQFAEVAQ